MKITVSLSEESESETWDTIVNSSPQGTIFHQWVWLKLASKHCKGELFPLIIRNGDIPVAILPLFLQKMGGMPLLLSPPNHSGIPYLGPVFNEIDSLKQHKKEHLTQEIMNHIEQYIGANYKPQYTSFILSPDLQDPRPFGWSGYQVIPRYDYLIDTTLGARKVCENFDRKLRMDIKRGISRNIEVSLGGKQELKKIFDLLIRRYREQDRMVFVPLLYLLDLHENFTNNFKIFCAYYNNELVSGYVNLAWKNELFLWIGNPKSNLPISPSPNDVCGWNSLKYACEEKFERYIFTGAAGNQRIHPYYAKYNPKLRIRYAVQKSSGMAKVAEYSYLVLYKPISEKLRIAFHNKQGNTE